VSIQPKTLLTPEQYLEIERRAETKSEYWQGEMSARDRSSREHNLLAMNLLAGLHHQLRGKPCEVLGSDMRVWIPATCLYTYPDVVAVCGEPQLADAHRDTLMNPVFLAEILSPSTEAYDRGRKFEHYRTVESLQEYLLVAQDHMHADLYTRQPDGSWLLHEASHAEDRVELQSLVCQLSLGDLYENVNLPASNPRSSTGAAEPGN
jgi:Uma2 family endonuclease